jgi:hypothetical protein
MNKILLSHSEQRSCTVIIEINCSTCRSCINMRMISSVARGHGSRSYREAYVIRMLGCIASLDRSTLCLWHIFSRKQVVCRLIRLVKPQTGPIPVNLSLSQSALSLPERWLNRQFVFSITVGTLAHVQLTFISLSTAK